MTLKTLEEHNKKVSDQYADRITYPRPTGIACPKCPDGELHDTDGWTEQSLPPKRRVCCTSCGWKGHRLAEDVEK